MAKRQVPVQASYRGHQGSQIFLSAPVHLGGRLEVSTRLMIPLCSCTPSFELEEGTFASKNHQSSRGGGTQTRQSLYDMVSAVSAPLWVGSLVSCSFSKPASRSHFFPSYPLRGLIWLRDQYHLPCDLGISW